MNKELKFLNGYDKFSQSEKAFNKIGIENYKKRRKIIERCKEKGWLVEPRKNIILEITEKGKEKLREKENE